MQVQKNIWIKAHNRREVNERVEGMFNNIDKIMVKKRNFLKIMFNDIRRIGYLRTF